jgi:hypothetical protein
LQWLDQPDEMVVGRRFSTACYVEHSVPAVVYLAPKVSQRPRSGPHCQYKSWRR